MPKTELSSTDDHQPVETHPATNLPEVSGELRRFGMEKLQGAMGGDQPSIAYGRPEPKRSQNLVKSDMEAQGKNAEAVSDKFRGSPSVWPKTPFGLKSLQNR